MVIPCERTLFSSADLNFSVRDESFAVGICNTIHAYALKDVPVIVCWLIQCLV